MREFVVRHNSEDLAVLKEFFEASELAPVIDRRYALSEVPELYATANAKAASAARGSEAVVTADHRSASSYGVRAECWRSITAAVSPSRRRVSYTARFLDRCAIGTPTVAVPEGGVTTLRGPARSQSAASATASGVATANELDGDR
jgi:hypothetical protein